MTVPSAVPTYRLYRERSGESGDFWIHCETIPARTHLHKWEIARHRHDAFFQIFLVTHGSGEMEGSKGAEAFSAPCVLFIPRGAVHGFRFARDVDGLVLTALTDRLELLAAADRTVASFAQQTRIVPLGLDPGLLHRSRTTTVRDDIPGQHIAVVSAVGRIHEEMTDPARRSRLLTEALMTDAIVSLVRIADASAGDDAPSDRDARRLDQLEDLIAAHLREHRSTAFYAARLGLSAPHLTRLARRNGGLSVQERIARHLLDAARRELVFTPTSVQAIAYGLGFSDAAYFNRFFRRQTGMTPGAFRLSERQRLAA